MFLFFLFIKKCSQLFRCLFHVVTDILYGNKLQYVAVEAEIEANIRSLSYAQGIPVREKWEEFFNKQVK